MSNVACAGACQGLAFGNGGCDEGNGSHEDQSRCLAESRDLAGSAGCAPGKWQHCSTSPAGHPERRHHRARAPPAGHPERKIGRPVLAAKEVDRVRWADWCWPRQRCQSPSMDLTAARARGISCSVFSPRAAPVGRPSPVPDTAADHGWSCRCRRRATARSSGRRPTAATGHAATAATGNRSGPGRTARRRPGDQHAEPRPGRRGQDLCLSTPSSGPLLCGHAGSTSRMIVLVTAGRLVENSRPGSVLIPSSIRWARPGLSAPTP